MFERDLVRSLVALLRRWPEEVGAVSTEYGLLLTLIALAIIAAAAAFGVAVVGLFETASSSIPVA